MREFKYVIQDALGIHARPAGVLVKAANAFDSRIELEKRGKKGDLKRIFSVMALGVKKDDEIIVRIEGADEDEAAHKLEELFKQQL